MLACVLLAPWIASGQTQVRSAEIAADRRVTFRVMAPAAHEVTLTGEFQSGSKPLEKNSAGLWSITIGPLEPEIYNSISPSMACAPSTRTIRG